MENSKSSAAGSPSLKYREERILRSIYLDMVISVSVFSAVILIFGLFLGWELWMFPVIIVGSIVNYALYLSTRVPLQTGFYVSGGFFILLVFYYCMKAYNLYESGIVILVMMLLFLYTHEKLLIWTGALAGIFGLVFRQALMNPQAKEISEVYSLAGTLQFFILLVLSIFLMMHIVGTTDRLKTDYQEKIEDLTRENAKVYDFLANVSHELRTPVSAVIGIAEIMETEAMNSDEGCSRQTLDRLKAISEAGYRVSEQIRDILDYTEIDMGTLIANNDEYMIASLINDLITQLSALESSGLELVVDVHPHTPSVLMGDETKIKRILWHLIRNAIKYTKTGGIYLHVYPVRRDYGINLIMEVKDTGIGMNEEELDAVYDSFYQSDSGRSRAAGGIGLGVPIVNGLAEAMRGVMSIDSREGQGTKVLVSIPQEVVDDSPCMSTDGDYVVAGFLGFLTTSDLRVRDFYLEMVNSFVGELPVQFHRVLSRRELEKLMETVELTHVFVGTGEYLENRSYIDGISDKVNVVLVADMGFDQPVGRRITVMPKPFYGSKIVDILRSAGKTDEEPEDMVIRFPDLKALVVDDEHMNLVVAKEIFGNYGMKVTCASRGREAVELCENTDFDIIFMDHMMPEMDGVEAMHRIRQTGSKRNREICIVALTANASSRAKEMFLKEGFDGFIPKPIRLGELERVLRSVLPKSAVAFVPKSDVQKNEKPQKRLPEKAVEVKTESVEAAPPKDPMEALRRMGVDVEEGITHCAGDEGFYRELLHDFSVECKQKREQLAECFEKQKWEDYLILIHGLKSSTELIGAMAVSRMAKQLEAMAKQNDVAAVQNGHPEFLREFDRLMTVMVFDAEGSKGGDE